MADPRFVLVKSVSPHNGGNFRRAGLRFTRDWRPLEVAARPDLDKGVIDDDVLEVLQAETFLAVKPATADEVARLADAKLDASRDKDSELAGLRDKNAELEARVAALGDLEARLKRLESAPAPTAPTPTSPTAPAASATDKPAKPATTGR